MSKLVEIERFSKRTHLEQFIYWTFCEKSCGDLPLNWVRVYHKTVIAFVFSQIVEWTLALKKDLVFELYIILDSRWIFLCRTHLNYQELEEVGFSSNDFPEMIEDFLDVTLDTETDVKFHGFVLRTPQRFNVKPFVWHLSNVKPIFKEKK